MLKKLTNFEGYKGPVVVIVMDGIGISENTEGNAVYNAYTPNLDNLLKQYPNTLINAHGSAVGLPSDDDMGNSEVGHNAIGSGQIYSQGAKLVNEAIKSGKMFEGSTWKQVTGNVQMHGSTLHFWVYLVMGMFIHTLII